MKVYVDELPECCMKCPCMNDDIDYGNNCNISKVHLEWDEYQNFRHKDCPLETTQSLKQQVREDVVEEIREKFNTEVRNHFCPNPSSVDFITLCISEVEEFLDQVKGEKNGRKIRI